MEDNEIQPQETETQEVEPVGDVEPQPEVEPEKEELGAEAKPQEKVEEKPPEPRLYSEEEWSKRESEKDKETAQIRNQLAQFTLASQIAKTQEAEKESQAQDQREVDEGTITPVEASQRQKARDGQKQQQEAIQKQAGVLRQMGQQAEQFGRVLAAQDFGKQYDLSPEQVKELLTDKEAKTPGDMKAKAADLALERERGKVKKATEAPSKFDSGISGTKGAYTDDMSAEDKIRWALLHQK